MDLGLRLGLGFRVRLEVSDSINSDPSEVIGSRCIIMASPIPRFSLSQKCLGASVRCLVCRYGVIVPMCLVYCYGVIVPMELLWRRHAA